VNPPPCPFLPAVRKAWPAAALARFRGRRQGAAAYAAALRCAQSRWLAGLPAQALLMLDRALACDLSACPAAAARHPPPYQALAWILRHAPPDAFLGNPRRHFQHLATRMNNGPMRELRIWRAWACWAIVRRARPGFPADTAQLDRDGLHEPTPEPIFRQLARLGPPGEAAIARAAWERASEPGGGSQADPAESGPIFLGNDAGGL
jgi:hypothetical protein